MIQLVRKICSIFVNINVIETAMIAALVWWALILAVPFETFDSSKSYAAMSGIASEEVWAVIFFAVGMMILYGMLANSYRMQMVGLILSNGLWIFVAAMFGISNIATTGTGIYFIVAYLNTYVIYKVGEQRGR